MTRPIYKTNQGNIASNHGWAIRQLQRRPAMIDTGQAIYEIKVFEETLSSRSGIRNERVS